MVFIALVPLACFILLSLFLFEKSSAAGPLTRIRVAMMYATLVIATFILVITEALSLFKLINLPGLLVSWLGLLSVIIFLCYKDQVGLSSLREIGAAVKVFFKQHWPPVIIIGSALLFSLFVALIYPPNNFDSMTYHLGRIGHWIMQQSIADYPTHILRQLVFPPLSEWMIMHLQILTGGDRFSNSVQTFFFGGCILQVSLIARQLGGNPSKQLLSAIFTCLIPMALIESNTTQNDIVVGYFVLAFIYFIIRIFRDDSLKNILWAGVALGLAMFTKGTAYLFFIFFGWFVFVLLRRKRQPLKEILFCSFRLMIVPAIAFLFSSLHFYRNYELNGSILGKANEGVANEEHKLKPLMLVAFKNFLSHMPVSNENKRQLTAFSQKHGLDVNDPKYSYQTIDQMVTGFKYHEDYMQNCFHAIFIILFGFVFLARKKLYTRPPDLFVLFVLTIYAIAAAFCVFFKWQPWGNRLETSLFLVFCIVLGMLAGDFPAWLQWLFITPLLYTALLAMLYNGNHPILPWKENIFVNGYDEFIFNKDEYRQEKKFFDTTSIRKFGLQIGSDSWDYPYYKLLSESKISNNFTLKHIYVTNESNKYCDGYVPEAYLTHDMGRISDTLGGKIFYRSKVFGNRMVLFRVRE